MSNPELPSAEPLPVKPSSQEELDIEAEPSFTFEPLVTLQLTGLGMAFLLVKDRIRLKNMEDNSGKYPEDIAKHLKSRIQEKTKIVVMTKYDYEDNLGALIRLAGVRQVVEHEILPSKPKVPDTPPPATMSSNGQQPQRMAPFVSSSHYRSDQQGSPSDSSPEPRKGFAARLLRRRR